MGRHSSLAVTAVVVTALIAAACGSSSASHGTSLLSQPTANVGYAGSLTGIVETALQPAFENATGDAFVGKGEGSSALAQAILDKELSPGAFVAVGKSAIKLLWPSRSHFLITLATDPLVVAYSPNSPDAAQLNKIRSGAKPLKDLFALMETNGFRLGRTNPNLDPQGAYFELMVKLATKQFNLPANTPAKILGTTGKSASSDVGSSSQILDEDAGSEYLTEAKQYKLDYIALPARLDFADPADVSIYSTVSLNLLQNTTFPGNLITLNETYVLPASGTTRSTPDSGADAAWLAFLLSSTGQALLTKVGYTLEPPQLSLAPGFTSAKAVLPAPVLAGYNALGGVVSTS
jgi:molybdate/tungstate transport system substrate-binding protein